MTVFAYGQKFWSAIPAWLRNVVPYGLSFKLFSSGLIVALGGAGALGYISDYATYWFAFNAGIRTPLEGVPYIKAAVTATSIFLLISSGLLFALSIFVVNFSLNLFRSHFGMMGEPLKLMSIAMNGKEIETDYESVMSHVRSLPTAWKIGCVIVTSALITGVVYLIERHPLPVGWSMPGRLPTTAADRLSDTAFGLIFLYLISIVSVMVFPKIIWGLGFSFVSFYFLSCVWLMFQPYYYAEFLRFIGYGGGLPISVRCKTDTLRPEVCEGNISLILRTNETLVLFNSGTQRFYEIPKDSFVYVAYRTGGLDRLIPLLPRYGGSKLPN